MPEKAVELFTKIDNEGQLTHDRFSYNGTYYSMINECIHRIFSFSDDQCMLEIR